MDESYLTGEPYLMSKAPGSAVLSGAVNGETALTIRCRQAGRRFALRQDHAGDAGLGAAPAAPAAARRPARGLLHPAGRGHRPGRLGRRAATPTRFLAVLVVATPCPLLIAIPVAIIGSVSLSARRGIIIKDPAVLEKVATCRTAIFDKTGTLTYGQPQLTELLPAPGWEEREVLALVAGLERYSKHPLAGAVLAAAEKQGVALPEAARGQRAARAGADRRGVRPIRPGHQPQEAPRGGSPKRRQNCPPPPAGWSASSSSTAATPRPSASATSRGPDGAPFIRHLGRRHHFDRVMLVSGDRESEVRYLAEQVGITEVYAGQTPEQKLEIVRAGDARRRTRSSSATASTTPRR